MYVLVNKSNMIFLNLDQFNLSRFQFPYFQVPHPRRYKIVLLVQAALGCPSSAGFSTTEKLCCKAPLPSKCTAQPYV